MSDSGPKKKMVILRLSDAEYQMLKLHYRSFGVQSISEFASLALQRTLTESPVEPDGLKPLVVELDSRVRELESLVSQLMEREKVAN